MAAAEAGAAAEEEDAGRRCGITAFDSIKRVFAVPLENQTGKVAQTRGHQRIKKRTRFCGGVNLKIKFGQ